MSVLHGPSPGYNFLKLVGMPDQVLSQVPQASPWGAPPAPTPAPTPAPAPAAAVTAAADQKKASVGALGSGSTLLASGSGTSTTQAKTLLGQ